MNVADVKKNASYKLRLWLNPGESFNRRLNIVKIRDFALALDNFTVIAAYRGPKTALMKVFFNITAVFDDG